MASLSTLKWQQCITSIALFPVPAVAQWQGPIQCTALESMSLVMFLLFCGHVHGSFDLMQCDEGGNTLI